MSTDKTDPSTPAHDTSSENTWTGPRRKWVPIVVLIACTVAAAGLTWLLTTIFTHQQESKHPFTQVVEITDTTYDPAVWGQNFPLQYEAYLRTAEMDEAEWMTFSATLRTRPIMPDFALRAMHDDDRRAIYRFIRSLGTGGTKAPEYLPPGSAPPAPFFQLVLPPAPPANPPAGG